MGNERLVDNMNTSDREACEVVFKMLEIRATVHFLQKQAKKNTYAQTDMDKLTFILSEIPHTANFNISGARCGYFRPAVYTVGQILAKVSLTEDFKVQFSKKQAEIYQHLYGLTPRWSQKRSVHSSFRVSKFALYKSLRHYPRILRLKRKISK